MYQRFLEDLQTAHAAMGDLATRHQNESLTWRDGSPIIAYGEEVGLFQATEAQYRDGGLFGEVDAGPQGLGTLGLFSQYDARQASQHYGEIVSISAAASSLDGVYDRAYWSALGGGAESSTIDVDIALTLTGAGAIGKAITQQGVRNWLQSRVYNSEATNRAVHEVYKTSVRQQMSKPSVQDSRLSRIVDELYRPNARVGSGSTADAIRYEVSTGQSVGGRLHSQKGVDAIRALERLLSNNPAARPGDRAAAENIILDLRDALGR